MVEPRPDGGAQWTTERFQEWLAQTAQNEDRTEQEILHRMMASFWVLNEFEDLVGPDDAPTLNNLQQNLESPQTDEIPWAPQSDQQPNPSEETQPADTDADPDPTPDPELVRGLVENFATYLDEQAPTQPNTTTESGPSQNTPAKTHQEEVPGEVADRLEDIEEMLTDLQTQQNELAGDVSELADGHLALADTVDELTTQHEGLDDAHASLEERVETDMEKVEQILKRLTNKYRDADETLDHVESTLTSILEARRTTEKQREQLASLLQTAHAHGVETGTCEDCNATIHLGLLATPRCPHCSKLLVGITPGGWFRSDIIETTQPQHPQHHTQRPGAIDPPHNTHAETEYEQRHSPQYTTTPNDQRATGRDDHEPAPPDDEEEDPADQSASFEWADE